MMISSVLHHLGRSANLADRVRLLAQSRSIFGYTLDSTTSTSKFSINQQHVRHLSLQEYQSKQILHENGIAVQKFKIASNDKELSQVLFPEHNQSLPHTKWSGFEEDISGAKEFVIKAQVLAGGRGKGKFVRSSLEGGVKLTENRAKALEYGKMMLNDRLITKQTSADGVLVEKVMIAEAVRLKKEFYFAILLDRGYEDGTLMVASPEGGMDIEEVAEKNSHLIRKFTVPLGTEIDLDTARKIVLAGFDLDLRDRLVIDQLADQIIKLHALFLKSDALQIEINPLGVTLRDQVVCVDAKISFDENARFRQTWLNELEVMNKTETDSREYAARKHNLNFIGLNGSIGCLVNGAGLAMATMDLIKLHGGEPANFLDVGGGASAEQVRAALDIIKSDNNVKAIFVNIFGGIMRCDTVSQGLIDAVRSLDITIPIVIRLEGTRVKEAREMIEDAGLNLIMHDNLDKAALEVVNQANR